MTAIRTADISQRLSRFLARFSAPQGIRDNPQASQDEADALLRILLKYAPSGVEAGPWVDRALEACAMTMKTRAWPTMQELGAACANQRKSGTADPAGDGVEAAMVDRMADWFGKFGDQLPGCGKPSRTAELIRRGVLANEREAKIKGFDLGQDQARRAMEQPMGIDESRHHDGILFDLRAASERLQAGRQETPPGAGWKQAGDTEARTA
jgi:hypothetical protein